MNVAENDENEDGLTEEMIEKPVVKPLSQRISLRQENTSSFLGIAEIPQGD
jgi:MFS family permease